MKVIGILLTLICTTANADVIDCKSVDGKIYLTNETTCCLSFSRS